MRHNIPTQHNAHDEQVNALPDEEDLRALQEQQERRREEETKARDKAKAAKEKERLKKEGSVRGKSKLGTCYVLLTGTRDVQAIQAQPRSRRSNARPMRDPTTHAHPHQRIVSR